MDFFSSIFSHWNCSLISLKAESDTQVVSNTNYDSSSLVPNNNNIFWSIETLRSFFLFCQNPDKNKLKLEKIGLGMKLLGKLWDRLFQEMGEINKEHKMLNISDVKKERKLTILGNASQLHYFWRSHKLSQLIYNSKRGFPLSCLCTLNWINAYSCIWAYTGLFLQAYILKYL